MVGYIVGVRIVLLICVNNETLNSEDILKCPNCCGSWDGGDILEVLKENNPHKDGETLREWASHYGYSEDNPRRFQKCIGVYDMERDVTSHVQCPHCNIKYKRV